jgi:ABC-2 type transport system permease protein
MMAVEATKAWLVASREYLDNVRTRGFWLSILLMPILLLVVSVAPLLLADAEAAPRYTVLDHSGWVQRAVAMQVARRDAALLIDALAQLSSDELPKAIAQLPALPTPEDRAQLAEATALAFVQLQSGAADPRAATSPGQNVAGWWYHDPEAALRAASNMVSPRYQYVPSAGLDRAELNGRLARDELLGYFVIPDDPVADGSGAQYVTRKLTNLDVRNWYSSQVTDVVRDRRIREENIGPATADWIQAPVQFDTTRLTDSGTETDAELADTITQWAPVAFVYLLWISIFSVTQMLLTNTVEEKSNKLVEVLLSAIAPVDLMAGKILGIAATGITIVSAWLVLFLAVVLWLPGALGASISVDLTGLIDNPIYLASFAIYFVLGYLFYAALLCGIGSLANNLKEAQTLMMPIQLLLIVPLIVMIPIGRDPHGMLAQVLSWLPPFTPFVMMNRAAFPPSLATYVGTTLLMLLSIYAALVLAARVFETGILMTGKPPRLRQLISLLRGSRS